MRVSGFIVHESFTDFVNDIALLKLGKNNQPTITHINSIKFTEERVDLSVFRPACLPGAGEDLVGQEGHVYGELNLR